MSKKMKLGSKGKNSSSLNKNDVSRNQQTENGTIEDYDDDSVFCNLLKKAELKLKSSNHSNELNVESIEFYKKLTIHLKRHENYPQVIDEFLEGFQQYIEDKNRFKQGLLPCIAPEDSLRTKQPPCLIRLLLNVELIQTKLITILLEKLPEFMDDEPLFECDENMNIPRQVLAQLQWLDHIEDMTALREKLLEILMVTSLDVQREIISCLPEIMDAAEHEQVVGVLKELFEQSPALTILILDTMSNLVLNKDLLSEVLATVLKTLPSCRMDDLPIVVKFILNSVNVKAAVGVFHEMRISLEFDATLEPMACSTPAPGSSKSTKARDNQQNNEIPALELLTMKSIHSCLQFQKSLVAPWIKVLEQVHGSKEHKVVDVFLLLIIHSLKHTKAVESLFRNKIRSGDFTEKLLKYAFSRHASVMQEYFDSVLSLALAFMCSPETSIQHFACIIYKNAFENLDKFCRQEIVGNLVTHIGSGMAQEMDTALDILADLSESCLDLIAPFAIFVKGLLDYTDRLKMSQIRKVYFAISKLAFHSDKDGGRTKNELHMVIRKQLMSNKLRYKQNGIIGAIMLIKSVISSSDPSVPPEILKDVLSLLELMNTSSKNMPKAHSLFMDELSSLINQTTLHPKVLEWLSDKVINDFQDNYVVDLDKNLLNRDSFLPLDFQFGLDEDTGENIALNILPLLENADGGKTKNVFEDDDNSGIISPLCIVPTFRLLALCESQRDPTLDDIMALLGCPVCIMKPHVFDKFDSLSKAEKEAVCTCLFYTFNWFREIINMFSSQKEPEVLVKVVMRLQHITDVLNHLEKCLAATPGYVPPIACFDVDEAEIVPPSTEPATSSSVGKRGKKSTKRKKGDKESEDTCDSTLADLDSTEANSEIIKETSEVGINLDNYYQYFRELDINVMDILLVGPITSKSLDTQMNTESLQDVKVSPAQVEFLLKDLNRKLKHSLPTSTRKSSFGRVSRNNDIGFTLLNQKSPAEIFQKIITLLPALCQQLEGSSAFFQSLIASNDGMLDGPGHTTPEFQRAALCFQLLIEIFHSLFLWKDLTIPANSSLMKSIMSLIASRIKGSTNSDLPVQESFNLTMNYMYNFGNTVPNLQAAVKLTELLVTLTEKRSTEQNHKPGELAEMFLKRTWLNSSGQPEKGAKFNAQIKILLKYFISFCNNPLDALSKLTNDAIPELLDSSRKASEMYPTLTLSSFSMFYRVLFAELVANVKAIPAAKKGDSYELRKEKILQWNWAVRIFHVLITFLKKFDALPNLGTALKTGRIFVDAFTVHAMPLLDQMYRSQHENIQSLLKSMQLSTRSLHHICGHSKIVKSLSLTNQIPLVKKSLEQLMLRVKEMLSINKCEEGYMVGILKNRDLMGEEIRSQSSSSSPAAQEDEPEDEDEVMSEEEKLSDVEMEVADDKPEENEEEESYSEVY